MEIITKGLGFLLPLLCFAFGVLITARKASLGRAILWSLLGVYSWAAFVTVSLSYFAGLTPSLAWIWWGGALLVCFGIFLRLQKRKSKAAHFSQLNFSPVEWLCILLIGISLFGALVMGICSAPNNGDVLIYHLPRQLLWISQGSVFPPAMPYSHMHQMPPFTEWIGVQLYLLTGSDRFHFLIQWSAFGACLILVGGIARSLGADRKQALLAAAFFATLPAAFFQASNSKNDVFLAALLLGIFQLALEGVWSRRFAFWETACCAYLAALAVLAKGTAFAYLPFAAVAVGTAILKNWKSRQLLAVAAGLLIFTLTVSPHYLVHFAEIFTSESGDSSHHANARIGVATGASVFLRNFALQLALPFDSWNKAVEKSAGKLVERTGIPVGDSGSTFHGAPFEVTYQPFMEDRASGFFHFVLPLVMLFLCWFVMRDAPLRHAVVLSATAFLGSVFLFSMLFRYQIWHSRLMIPAVAVAAPGVGIFLGSLRCRGVAFSILCVLALWLAPSLSSWARPLVGKLTVFQMDEDAAVSRAGCGASFLPSYGKAMSNARITNVGLDLQNGVVHAAIRFLPLSTNYDFPATASYADFGAEGLLSNLPIQQLSEDTKTKTSKMERVASVEGWNLWLRPENTLRAESKVIDLPNLWGVEEVEGLGEWQGPYPQFNAGVFARLNNESAVFRTTKPYLNAILQISTKFESNPGEFSIIRNGNPIHAQPKSQKATIEIPLGEVGLGETFEISNQAGDALRMYAFRIIEGND
jgi:4-amino-4-deoxy-L-arabinose transferase-like glycosyltransferase